MKVYDLDDRVSINEYYEKKISWYITSDPNCLWLSVQAKEIKISSRAKEMLKERRANKNKQYIPEYKVALRELKGAVVSRNILQI
jgi:hypothetical protein